MTNNINDVFDKVNVLGAVFVGVLSYIFGEHWILFLGFLLLNIGDWITGTMKARLAKKSNSVKGANGVIKKFGYWLMILTAYGMGAIFFEIGRIFDMDLVITQYIGLFVLAALIINEFRSILENFVEAGYNVPKILVDGLEVADKALDKIYPDKEKE